ncbi:9922_t:CDS:1, partial [Dentiscutata erythropus]
PIELNEILSNYIIEFQSIIEVIKDKTITDEEMSEELELLLSLTEISEEALKEMCNQICEIILNFIKDNDVLKEN